LSTPPSSDLPPSLVSLMNGDEAASAKLVELVYGELRALAGAYFGGQGLAHTLQPTALVHEAFLKVAAQKQTEYQDQSHFFAVCAITMRSILADHARRRRAVKRGGNLNRVGMQNIGGADKDPDLAMLALDEALTQLASRSPRQARIVEYRFFAGMTVEEVAQVLEVSRSTVEEEWRMARAWLAVQIKKGDES
jgi:RNA polymerase sigma factor (TIGR02999 family)